MVHGEIKRRAGSIGFPCAGFLSKEGTARGVQIDIAPDMLSLRYPVEVNLVGDSAPTLRALLPLLDRKTERSWRGHIEKNVAAWWRVPEARAHTSGNPINPQRVTWELSSRLPEHTIITSDSGSCANWHARDVKIRRVLEIRTDPEVPPLPPHITLTQAKHFASTVVHGDPQEGSVIVGAAKKLLSSILPRHGK